MAEAEADEDSGDEDDSGDEAAEESEEAASVAEAEEKVVAEERVLVTASAAPVVPLHRQPPKASAERTPAIRSQRRRAPRWWRPREFKDELPGPLNPDSLAHLMRDVGNDLGSVAHDGKLVTRQRVDPWQVDTYADGRKVEHGGGFIQWDGPKTKVARQRSSSRAT